MCPAAKNVPHGAFACLLIVCRNAALGYEAGDCFCGTPAERILYQAIVHCDKLMTSVAEETGLRTAGNICNGKYPLVSVTLRVFSADYF